MSKQNSCTRDTWNAYTHPPAHLHALARPGTPWVSERSPGVCTEDTSHAGPHQPSQQHLDVLKLDSLPTQDTYFFLNPSPFHPLDGFSLDPMCFILQTFL